MLFLQNLNPIANAFPAACGGVSEQNYKMAFSSRIEDSPQLAAESFNVTSGRSTSFLLPITTGYKIARQCFITVPVLRIFG
jgi:hypothetical protein